MEERGSSFKLVALSHFIYLLPPQAKLFVSAPPPHKKKQNSHLLVLCVTCSDPCLTIEQTVTSNPSSSESQRCWIPAGGGKWEYKPDRSPFRNDFQNEDKTLVKENMFSDEQNDLGVCLRTCVWDGDTRIPFFWLSLKIFCVSIILGLG